MSPDKFAHATERACRAYDAYAAQSGDVSASHYAMQAALAAAFPALVQQVERLTAEVAQLNRQRRWNIERVDGGGIHICEGDHHRSHDCEFEYYVPKSERDTLSADNARLAKDAERWQELVPRFKGITSYGKPRAYFIQLEITGHEPIVPLPDLVDWLIAHKSDAAAAQVKQS
jgi:hypothetical protein